MAIRKFIKEKKVGRDLAISPENFIEDKLASYPDKIVLTPKIDKSKINGKEIFLQEIVVYNKAEKKDGEKLFKTTSGIFIRKWEGFVVESLIESIIVIWGKTDLSLQENESLWDYCKRLNDLSYNKICGQAEEWNEKVDSQIKRNWLQYFTNVQGVFDEWYYLNKNDFQTRIPFPSRRMKDIVIETTQSLIDLGRLTYKGNETDNNPIYSSVVIDELKNNYIVTESNIHSIGKYFSKCDIKIVQKGGKIIVKKMPS